jgi:hypothetical protein
MLPFRSRERKDLNREMQLQQRPSVTTPCDVFALREPQNPVRSTTQPQTARATPTPNPCGAAIPTNSNDRAVLATLLGEASTPGENTWTSDQSGINAYRHPSGTLSEENVYDEMLQMVAVVDHRLTDWGQREGYSNWQDVVQAPGQFLGYGNGQSILQNLGAEGSGNCVRARLGVAAINAFHSGPWTSRFYYWKGIKQQNARGQMFIRALNGAWRWANTDFQVSQ